MSQEDVELLRRFIEAFNRGDLEGAIALVDPPPEFDFVPPGDFIPYAHLLPQSDEIAAERVAATLSHRS